MPPRHHDSLPRFWLLTDERQGDELWRALKQMPREAGVVVRHYSLPLRERISLARQIAATGRFVAWSGFEADARRARARAVYCASHKRSRLPHIAPVHDAREIVAAKRASAALLMLSPVFPTRSHPGGRTLGPIRFGLMTRRAGRPIIALGGMSAQRFRRVQAAGAAGWAAIDGWIRT